LINDVGRRWRFHRYMLLLLLVHLHGVAAAVEYSLRDNNFQ